MKQLALTGLGEPRGPSTRTIYTVGHSNQSAASFINLLQVNGVKLVADIRSVPGSTYCPQFGKVRLRESLKEAGIAYVHLAGLGGLKKATNLTEANNGWEHQSLHSYADNMASRTFKDAAAWLERWASLRPTVIMCAEAVPWRCHRRLITDWLIIRGWAVRDIIGSGPTASAKLTPFAVCDHGELRYPGAQPSLFKELR